MKSLNQNVLGVINAAVSSCDLISGSSFPECIRKHASSLCSLLGGLTLEEINLVRIDLPELPQTDSSH